MAASITSRLTGYNKMIVRKSACLAGEGHSLNADAATVPFVSPVRSLDRSEALSQPVIRSAIRAAHRFATICDHRLDGIEILEHNMGCA